MDSKSYEKRIKKNPEKRSHRLYSTVVIIEKNQPTKTVVPAHWVDSDSSVVYFPPKGYKAVGMYIAEWAVPEPGWQEFEFVEYILDSGTLETSIQKIKMNKRAASPVIDFASSPTSSSQRFTPSDILETPATSSKLNIASLFKQDHSCKTTNLFEKPSKVGDGGSSFKEMSNKQFQYAIFKELTNEFTLIKQNQKKIIDRLDLLESNFVSVMGVSNDTIEADVIMKPIDSLEKFDEQENTLNSSKVARLQKIRQIRSVSGPTPQRTIKNVLDCVLGRSVQNCFSKDGLKGKRKFLSTALYKCLKTALISDKGGFEGSDIERLVGDLLKRAVPKLQKEESCHDSSLSIVTEET
nr:uncharacterized protein LOC124815624 [Hydra vulgaris]